MLFAAWAVRYSFLTDHQLWIKIGAFFLLSLMCERLSVILLHYHFMLLICLLHQMHKVGMWNFPTLTKGGAELHRKSDLLCYCTVTGIPWKQWKGWLKMAWNEKKCDVTSFPQVEGICWLCCTRGWNRQKKKLFEKYAAVRGHRLFKYLVGSMGVLNK